MKERALQAGEEGKRVDTLERLIHLSVVLCSQSFHVMANYEQKTGLIKTDAPPALQRHSYFPIVSTQ